MFIFSLHRLALYYFSLWMAFLSKSFCIFQFSDILRKRLNKLCAKIQSGNFIQTKKIDVKKTCKWNNATWFRLFVDLCFRILKLLGFYNLWQGPLYWVSVSRWIYVYYQCYLGQLANQRTFGRRILDCKTKIHVSKYKLPFLHKSNSTLCCCQFSVVIAPGASRRCQVSTKPAKQRRNRKQG